MSTVFVSSFAQSKARLTDQTALKMTLLLLVVILLDLLDWVLGTVDDLRDHPFWGEVIAWVWP